MQEDHCPQTKKRDCPVCGKWLGWVDLDNPGRQPTEKEWWVCVKEIQKQHNDKIKKGV